MGAGGTGAVEAAAQAGCGGAGLDVEVVEALDVVAQEADRRHHDVPDPALVQRSDRVVDVGLEPRVGGPAAAALPGEGPGADPGGPARQAGGAADRRLVPRGPRPLDPNAVGGEHQRRARAPLRRETLYRFI